MLKWAWPQINYTNVIVKETLKNPVSTTAGSCAIITILVFIAFVLATLQLLHLSLLSCQLLVDTIIGLSVAYPGFEEGRC